MAWHFLSSPVTKFHTCVCVTERWKKCDMEDNQVISKQLAIKEEEVPWPERATRNNGLGVQQLEQLFSLLPFCLVGVDKKKADWVARKLNCRTREIFHEKSLFLSASRWRSDRAIGRADIPLSPNRNSHPTVSVTSSSDSFAQQVKWKCRSSYGTEKIRNTFAGKAAVRSRKTHTKVPTIFHLFFVTTFFCLCASV